MVVLYVDRLCMLHAKLCSALNERRVNAKDLGFWWHGGQLAKRYMYVCALRTLSDFSNPPRKTYHRSGRSSGWWGGETPVVVTASLATTWLGKVAYAAGTKAE